MSAKIINGKEIAQDIRRGLKKEIQALPMVPGLAVVLVGDDPASKVYVGNKEKACKEVGFYSEVHKLAENTSEEELLFLIEQLNNNPKIHGILVQLPLPKHINEKEVINRILPSKDVDGFHPVNAGALLVGEKGLQPCTPKGCIRLIKEMGLEISGKKAIVVGRSNIVGKPIALMLLQENATVEICHSRTQDLAKEIKDADILVVAIGKANFITGEMIKPGAVVIDVGINRLEDGSLAGDVEFNSAKEVAGYITPVPGGVGPMTIAMLLENTLEAALGKELERK